MLRARGVFPRKAVAVEQVEQRVLLSVAGHETATIPGDMRTGPASKVGVLADLYADFQSAKVTQTHLSAAFDDAASVLTPVSQGMIVVDVIADGDPAQLEADVRALGMQNVARAGRIVSGYLPVDAINDLAVLDSVRSAQPSLNSTNTGTVNSQGDAAKKTDTARATWSGVTGITGTGVTVGVLSDSFDTGPGSYATDIGTANLPAGVVNLQDSAGGTDEGRAMLQLIHDTAPGSPLAFATANGGQANFANNITNLRNVAGADVIVDDVIYFAEPMFQDGVIAQSADAAVAAGVPFYSSAGNTARKSYESVWRNGVVRAGGSIPSAGGAAFFFGGTTFDFDPGAGVDDMQSFTLVNGAQALINFQWDQPFFSVSGGAGSLSECDAYILNSAGTQVISIGGNSASQFIDATETLSFTNTSGSTQTYQLMLVYDQTLGGPVPGFVKYVEFRSANFTQFVTNSGTAYGHTNAANADSIAAAAFNNTPVFGVNPPVVETFSSAGGVAIRFNTAGTPIAPLVRQTPDFTGPDGGNTSFFGTDSAADADAFPNFFGTSAAAPEIAALVALMRAVDFTKTPAQIRTILQNSCIDMDDPTTGGFDVGVDLRTGHGLVDGYKAFAQVIPVGNWTGLGNGTTFHQNTNWSRDTLPGATIDAVINMPFSNPSIVVDQVDSVKSLTTSEAISIPAGGNLTLAQTSTFNAGLTISAGLATLTAGGNKLIKTNSLSVTGTGRLNITDNDVIIDYTGGTPIATIEARVRSGYNVIGDWAGNGIRSSVAAVDGNFTVAIADNAALAAPFGTAQGGPLFSGVNVDLTTVLIKFTHRADINLDGLVTPDDSAIFGGNYDENQFANWAMGDLNYDGLFTPDDAAIFGGAYDDSLPQV